MRGLRQRLGVDIPLVGEERLDHDARAVAMRHHVRVRLDLVEQARSLPCARRSSCARRSDPGRAAPVSRRDRTDFGTPSRKSSLSFRAELGLDVEDIDQRQLVPRADLEIVEVMRRRDLDRAGALFRIGIFVGDDRDAAADQRQDRVACRSDACSARRPGCTATAVSPSIVSGRVVATDDEGRPGMPLDRIFEMPEMPFTSTCCTSRSEIAVCSFGSQLTSRLSL